MDNTLSAVNCEKIVKLKVKFKPNVKKPETANHIDAAVLDTTVVPINSPLIPLVKKIVKFKVKQPPDPNPANHINTSVLDTSVIPIHDPLIPLVKKIVKIKVNKPSEPANHVNATVLDVSATLHPALVRNCICGFRPDHTLINKKMLTLDEYDIWNKIKDMLGEQTSKFFSLPYGDPHTCKYGHVVSFSPCGYELASTETQKAIMKQSDPLSILMNIFINTARGLVKLHGIGIIHLDIKPDNIIVDTSTFESKIIDIGNAQYKHKPFITLPSINEKTKKIIVDTSFPYFPPHKFYFEEWLNHLTEDNALEMCNAVTELQSAHRKLIRNFYNDRDDCMKLINIYQRDDPRNNIYAIL